MAKKYSTDGACPPEIIADEFLDAVEFLQNRYPCIDVLEQLETRNVNWAVYTTPKLRRSAFYPPRSMFEGHHLGKGCCVILINTRYHKHWWTYKRRSIGVAAQGIKIPDKTHVTLKIIHELTHFIQMCESRRYSETETTKNELLYMFKYHNFYFRKCQIIRDRRRKKNPNFNCVL